MSNNQATVRHCVLGTQKLNYRGPSDPKIQESVLYYPLQNLAPN